MNFRENESLASGPDVYAYPLSRCFDLPLTIDGIYSARDFSFPLYFVLEFSIYVISSPPQLPNTHHPVPHIRFHSSENIAQKASSSSSSSTNEITNLRSSIFFIYTRPDYIHLFSNVMHLTSVHALFLFFIKVIFF